MRTQHWQDAVSTLLGVWLVLSPQALSFGGMAAWLSTILGLGVILFALEGLMMPSWFEEVGEIGMGLVLICVPWWMGYDSAAATYSSMITGALVMLFAIWEMMLDRDFIIWWNEHVLDSAG
ncbi:MAG: hypothetical protein HY255_08130 [Betaproteobacteria bacterium]|nr:hypothetical protein [Betaproteobacteria bacterium]